MTHVTDQGASKGDPQKAPLPQYSYIPPRWLEIVMAILGFTAKLLWIAMKLVVIFVLFIVAFIGVLVWRN